MFETIRQLDFAFATYSCVLNVSVMCQLCDTIVFITVKILTLIVQCLGGFPILYTVSFTWGLTPILLRSIGSDHTEVRLPHYPNSSKISSASLFGFYPQLTIICHVLIDFNIVEHLVYTEQPLTTNLLPSRLPTLLLYKKRGVIVNPSWYDGGEDEIRTHEGLSPLLVFKTSAFNRSATSPIL